jgi:cytochrome c
MVELLLAASLAGGTEISGNGNAEAGKAVYERCAGCHSFEYNRTGPLHCGLVGRKAGTAAGFEYSQAMRKSRITWDERALERFLAAPTEVVPGTTMTYAGVPDAGERRNLIAYLVRQGRSADCAK